MKTIVLTGGGTAGHVIPHFAVLNKVKKHFDNVYYIGSDGGIEEKLVKERNIEYFSIKPEKFRRQLTLKNLTLPIKTIKSVNDAAKILKRIKPDVVFSKGGYVGLPVTVAAKLLKIPVIIHESDLTMGLANKIAAKFSDVTLTSFDKTTNSVKNGVFAGAIIREELFSVSKTQALKYYNFSGKKPILLITGGSSGASFLNNLTVETLPKLLNDFDVLHITGKGNSTKIRRDGYVETEFTDMKYALAVCDFCVSRAGSNTAFELILKKIPTLFIPLPKKSSRGDQIENAEYFKSKGLARVLLQEDANCKNFYNEITLLTGASTEIKQNLTTFNYPIGNTAVTDVLKKY